MTTAGRKLKKQPVRLTAGLPEGCWVDVYELPWFRGRLRRLRGPGRIDDPQGNGASPGSLIVGPAAAVAVLDARRTGALRPRQIVPDLARARLAGKLKTFQIVWASSKTPARRSQ